MPEYAGRVVRSSGKVRSGRIAFPSIIDNSKKDIGINACECVSISYEFGCPLRGTKEVYRSRSTLPTSINNNGEVCWQRASQSGTSFNQLCFLTPKNGKKR